MRCKHCGVTVQELRSVDGPSQFVHSEPGDPPYAVCKLVLAAPDTEGAWDFLGAEQVRR